MHKRNNPCAFLESEWTDLGVQSLGDKEGVWGLKDTVNSRTSFPCRSAKEVDDVIALSDITPSGAADHSQEPSPVGSRRGHITPNLSRASSDVDHGAEEDKEEQPASQPDASSSQTVTPVAEPPSTEPTPPDGPTSLGPLDLLPSEELLTDTSNSSSSTGEEGGRHDSSLAATTKI